VILFRRRREEELFIHMMVVCKRLVWDNLGIMAWHIVEQFIPSKEERMTLEPLIFEAIRNDDIDIKVIKCIEMDGSNRDRARCIFNVLGFKDLVVKYLSNSN
jgi:hypothetical protein